MQQERNNRNSRNNRRGAARLAAMQRLAAQSASPAANTLTSAGPGSQPRNSRHISRKLAWIAAPAAMLAVIAALSLAGCGGGGAASGSKSAIQYTGPDGGLGGVVSGRVTGPAAVTLQRASGRQAAATGLTAKTTAPVFVYKINDDGIPTTTWLDSAMTNSSGDYTLTIPYGYAAGSNELVGCGSSSNLMRAFVTATGTIDITPVTEVVVSKVTASSQPLANFSSAEIIAMQTQANTDAANADYTGITSITAATTYLYSGTLKTNLDAAISAAGAAAKR